MKQNTTPILRIKHEGLDIEDVEKITYIFKAGRSKFLPAILKKTVLNPAENIVEVQLTREESYLFPPGIVYMDTEIMLSNGMIPETPIVEIDVNETLFKEEDSSD